MIAMFLIDDLKEPDDDAFSENQQITYDYATQTVLPMMTANGVWIAPAPRSPLTMEEIVRVFGAIIEHDSYRDQTMTIADCEGCWITYTPDGMVKVETPEERG